MQTRIRKKTAEPARPVTAELTRRELAEAAGSQAFRHRDPVYHVTEDFCQNFDRIGQKHARELLGEEEGGAFTGAGLREETEERRRGGAFRRAAEGGGVEQTALFPNTDISVHTFAETAFRRGTLAASVLRGTGKMMLTSCIRRAVNTKGPQSAQQRTVFGVGSQTRNIPGRDPDKMVFARGVSHSAVGLVVDTLRDARRTVQSMEDMARGTGDLRDGAENGTLRDAYPFLDDRMERELLAEYSARLSESGDGTERAVLQNAIVRTHALIEKKAQMKLQFIQHLRLMADRATEALKELEGPETEEEILRRVLGLDDEEEAREGSGTGAEEDADAYGTDDWTGFDGFPEAAETGFGAEDAEAGLEFPDE